MTERPAWFSLREDQPSPFQAVRLASENVQGWLAALAADCADPTTGRYLRELWAVYFECVPALRRGVEEKPWTRATGWELIEALEGGVSVRLGVEGFCPDLDRAVRGIFYVQALLSAGIVAIAEDPQELFAGPEVLEGLPPELRDLPARLRPVLVPLRAQGYLLAAPPAEREVARRTRSRQGHIGANVALLMLTSAVAEMLGGQLPDTAEALDRLTRAAVKKNWQVLKAIDPSLKTSEALRNEVGGQLFESIPTAWHSMDLLELLARGLAGELNVIMPAVRGDLLNRFEREETRERLVVRLTERLPDDENADEGDYEEGGLGHGLRDRRPDEEAEVRQILERIALTPDGRRLLDAIVESDSDEKTRRALAARLGMTDRTLRAKLAALRPRLSGLI